MFLKNSDKCVFAVTVLLIAGQAFGQFEVPWHTVDGGGGMSSTGGVFALSGTIGQHDAGSFTQPMTGGTFELVGGFWGVAGGACSCLGDMNHDGVRNGRDVQAFVECITHGGTCACADINGAQGPTVGDVPAFVTQLMSGAACP